MAVQRGSWVECGSGAVQVWGGGYGPRLNPVGLLLLSCIAAPDYNSTQKFPLQRVVPLLVPFPLRTVNCAHNQPQPPTPHSPVRVPSHQRSLFPPRIPKGQRSRSPRSARRLPCVRGFFNGRVRDKTSHPGHGLFSSIPFLLTSYPI